MTSITTLLLNAVVSLLLLIQGNPNIDSSLRDRVIFVATQAIKTIATTSTTTVIPNARTLYVGYVEIEPISFIEIKKKLEEQGCHTTDYTGERNSPWCMYREAEVPYNKENGLEIYPHGYGFGTISFYVTKEKLWTGKDIVGLPNPNNFKVAVRQDVTDIGGIVTLRESTWKITKTEYPWSVVY
jgi:hypothetical protein